MTLSGEDFQRLDRAYREVAEWSSHGRAGIASRILRTSLRSYEKFSACEDIHPGPFDEGIMGFCSFLLKLGDQLERRPDNTGKEELEGAMAAVQSANEAVTRAYATLVHRTRQDAVQRAKKLLRFETKDAGAGRVKERRSGKAS